MMLDDTTTSWASRFGLASSPLFGSHESSPAGTHNVLLDGRSGSFALSVSRDQLWKEPICADWSWSCNLPHHVTVTDREVAVVRWDKSGVELFTRNSVEKQLSAFYSYLTCDRVESNQRVVEFMLNVYRKMRMLVARSDVDDENSIDAFLAFLSCTLQETQGINASVVREYIVDINNSDLLASLPQNGLEALFNEVTDRKSLGLSPSLVPSLAVRHVGSEIFQQAHFELLRVPSPTFAGRDRAAETQVRAQKGAHFTPPALARTIVEQTLAQVSGLESRQELVFLDPVCGSGAFLHEALCALRRIGYQGRVVLVGRDISKAAITMAKFVLLNAIADWAPKGGCELDLHNSDSLTTALPAANVVLMNPPFVSWNALTSDQRMHMRDALGQSLAGRGDYCMAFVTRGLEVLSQGGALGTLLPANLLVLQETERWRQRIAEVADVRFVASLGDYGLFRYAQVEVCTVVVAKEGKSIETPDNVISLVTNNREETTSAALRHLRIAANATVKEKRDHGWHLFETPSREFRKRPTWRLITPDTDLALARLLQSDVVAPVEDLFSVRQGVRTGMNIAFIRTTAEVEALPERERTWFRPASINKSIQAGRILSNYYVFYPYDGKELAIRSEKELNEVVPTYTERYLQPLKERLSERPSIVHSRSSAWWSLSRRRSWTLDPSPRIVSKRFGGAGSFAVDFDGSYVVVQGFAWMPNWLVDTRKEERVSATFSLELHEILAAYAVIMNSSVFTRVLKLYSQHVGGGQYNLDWRYVRRMPVPNLLDAVSGEQFSDLIVELSQIERELGSEDPLPRQRIERLVTALYGVNFVRRI